MRYGVVETLRIAQMVREKRESRNREGGPPRNLAEHRTHFFILRNQVRAQESDAARRLTERRLRLRMCVSRSHPLGGQDKSRGKE